MSGAGRRVARGTALVAAAGLAAWAVWIVLVMWIALPLEGAVPRPPEAVDLDGVSHFHTLSSDGRRSLDHMLGAAREAGAEFAIVADHNVDPPEAAWREGVLLVPGVELSTGRGHLFALGGRRTAPEALRRSDPFRAAEAAGGLPVLAHPVNRRRPWDGSWGGALGAEVMSGDSLFREARARPWSRLLPALAALPADPDVAAMTLHQPHEAAFTAWAETLASGDPVLGLCGHDAHGFAADAALFRAMKLHVRLPEALPAEADRAAGAVVRAVGEGRVYCALDGLLDPRGFRFERVGREIRASLEYLRWPEEATAEVRLFRGRDEVVRHPWRVEVPRAEPGAWWVRVDLTVPWMGASRRTFAWIWAGPIVVPPPQTDLPRGAAGSPGGRDT